MAAERQRECHRMFLEDMLARSAATLRLEEARCHEKVDDATAATTAARCREDDLQKRLNQANAQLNGLHLTGAGCCLETPYHRWHRQELK